MFVCLCLRISYKDQTRSFPHSTIHQPFLFFYLHIPITAHIPFTSSSHPLHISHSLPLCLPPIASHTPHTSHSTAPLSHIDSPRAPALSLSLLRFSRSHIFGEVSKHEYGVSASDEFLFCFHSNLFGAGRTFVKCLKKYWEKSVRENYRDCSFRGKSDKDGDKKKTCTTIDRIHNLTDKSQQLTASSWIMWVHKSL